MRKVIVILICFITASILLGEKVTEKNYYNKKSKTDYSSIYSEILKESLLIEKSVKLMWWSKLDKNNGKSLMTSNMKKIADKYGVLYRDFGNTKKIFLTFDEGYENGYTEQILDILAKKNVKAAFFITGWYWESQEKLVRRMISEGHTLANHTVKHYNMPNISDEMIIYEIKELHERIRENTGYEMKYFRPPNGEFNEKVLFIAERLGYKGVFWSFSYTDWKRDNQRGKEYAFNQVTKNLHAGEILLLHAVSKDNANALEDIIDFAIENGYEFDILDNVVVE